MDTIRIELPRSVGLHPLRLKDTLYTYISLFRLQFRLQAREVSIPNVGCTRMDPGVYRLAHISLAAESADSALPIILALYRMHLMT